MPKMPKKRCSQLVARQCNVPSLHYMPALQPLRAKWSKANGPMKKRAKEQFNA